MADPSIGGADLCLLYVQHTEHSRQPVKDLKATFSHRPPLWKMSYAQSWVKTLSSEYKHLERDLNASYVEASRTRRLVSLLPQLALNISDREPQIMEQHGLGRARTAGIFALLASIFVPVGFTAVSVLDQH